MKASDVFTLFLQVCKYVLIRAGVRGAEYSGRQELAGSSGEVRNKLLLKVTLQGGLTQRSRVLTSTCTQRHGPSAEACKRSVQMETTDKRQKQSPLPPKLVNTVKSGRDML